MKAAAVLMIMLFTFSAAFAGPAELEPGVRCAECGMKVDASSRFAAQIITPEGKVLAFCDVGDMLHYCAGRPGEARSEVYVQDHETGAWTDALKATYKKDGAYASPMGWDIAAFSGGGGDMSFEEALALVR